MKGIKKVYIAFASVLVAIGALVALNVTGTATEAVSSYRDCADDTIIRCGAITEAELLQKYDQNVGDVQHIFPYYGITRNDLAGKTSEIKHGTVYQDGRVVVDGKTVATNAYSLSRLPFYDSAGRSPRVVKINGTTLYEGPNMSIFVRPVDAFVYFRNGQFYRAVLSACGNPLMATPVTPPTPPKPQPVYSCDTIKATKLDRTRFRFVATATAKNGSQIVNYTYDFGDNTKQTTTATTVEHNFAKPGNYFVTLTANIKVDGKTQAVSGPGCRVALKVEEAPKVPVYSCDSLSTKKIDRTKFQFTTNATAKDGAAITKYVYDFGDGKTATSTNKTVEHTYEKPGKYTVKSTVYFTVNGQAKAITDTKCQTTVTVEEAPKTPVFTCDSLKSTKISRTKFQFTASATAKDGAEIVSYVYNFGDGKTTTSTNKTVEHTYDKPGKYTAKVTVNFKVNGASKAATSKNCETVITVEEAPKVPVFTCNSLTSKRIDRTNYQFIAAATAKDGAEIVSYTYNFGDGKITTSTNNIVSHTYDKPGNYDVKVTVNFKVNGESKSVTSKSCETRITVEEAPKVPVYKCENLKVDKISRTEFRFTTFASAENGASIVSYTYNFGDGKTETVTGKTVDHTYEKPGKYTVKVTVNVKVNGSTKAVTSKDCETTVKVEEAPKPPVFTCDSLTYKKISRTQYQFITAATAENGAEIVSYTYDFGDGKATTSTNSVVDHTYEKPGNYTAKVTVNFKVNGQSKSVTSKACETKVTVEESPKVPVYTCDKLSAEKISRTKYKFTAAATAKDGAEIVDYTYEFGDGNTASSTDGSVEHEYDEPGKYTAKVTVNFNVNGEDKAITSKKCETTITVKEAPQEVIFRCDSLTGKLIESKDRTVEYTLAYTAEGGAVLNKVSFDFGDGKNAIFPADKATSVEHEYDEPGNYRTVATLYFNVKDGGRVVEKSVDCETEVSIPKPENCEIPGKEHLPKDSPDCVETPETPPTPPETPELPPELPQTGVEALLGGGLGLGSLAAASYYWIASRRNLFDTLNR